MGVLLSSVADLGALTEGLYTRLYSTQYSRLSASARRCRTFCAFLRLRDAERRARHSHFIEKGIICDPETRSDAPRLLDAERRVFYTLTHWVTVLLKETVSYTRRSNAIKQHFCLHRCNDAPDGLSLHLFPDFRGAIPRSLSSIQSGSVLYCSPLNSCCLFRFLLLHCLQLHSFLGILHSDLQPKLQ